MKKLTEEEIKIKKFIFEHNYEFISWALRNRPVAHDIETMMKYNIEFYNMFNK